MHAFNPALTKNEEGLLTEKIMSQGMRRNELNREAGAISALWDKREEKSRKAGRRAGGDLTYCCLLRPCNYF